MLVLIAIKPNLAHFKVLTERQVLKPCGSLPAAA